MKLKNALLVVCCILLTACLSLADGVPPDPVFGGKGGGGSEDITSFPFSFTLASCTVEEPPDPCNQFDHPQAAFAGDNDTGIPIDQLTLTLNYPKLLGDVLFTCNGGDLFSENNCPETLAANTTSVTFTLFKGTGTGIGCYDPADPEDAGNAACLGREDSGVSAFGPGSPDLPPTHFLFGVGFGGDPWPSTSIPTGGTTAPEPGTVALFLTGIGALVARSRSRNRASV